MYVEAAAHFARLAVMEGHHLVCGGTSKGLMSVLIGATVEAGGVIYGVVPKFMDDLGWTDKRLTQVTVVETMRQRKELLMKDVDAIVALPGAIGTLEELTEVLSLKRLGLFQKPVVIFNQNGFYNFLLRFFEEMRSEGMMTGEVWSEVDRVEDILPAIEVNNLSSLDLLHYHDGYQNGL